MKFGLILLIIIIIILIWGIGSYNKFIRMKNSIEEAFATMDVYLKKRWDLVPNLVNTVKAYAQHESSTFEKITKLRTRNYDAMSPTRRSKPTRLWALHWARSSRLRKHILNSRPTRTS